MNENEEDDEEMFYDANENVSPIIKGREENLGNNVENIFSFKTAEDKIIERKETQYEDPIDCEGAYKEMRSSDWRNSLLSTIKTFDTGIDINKEKENEKLRKLDLLHEDAKEINVDFEFLKKNMKGIGCKNKGIKDKHLQNIFELQNFQGDSQQIWACKSSYDGIYIATGGKSGVLKIWEIYTEDDSLDNYEYKGIISFFKLINETAYRIYTEHTQDIIDICWNQKVK